MRITLSHPHRSRSNLNIVEVNGVKVAFSHQLPIAFDCGAGWTVSAVVQLSPNYLDVRAIADGPGKVHETGVPRAEFERRLAALDFVDLTLVSKL